MNVFLSHIAEESPLAAAMKDALQAAVQDFEVFVSGVDIPLGRAWLDALDAAFDHSSAVLVLCSPRSIAKPWSAGPGRRSGTSASGDGDRFSRERGPTPPWSDAFWIG